MSLSESASQMESHLMVQTKTNTMFFSVKSVTKVLVLKKMIAGITKVPPNDQQLFYNGIVLDDNKSFEQCGLNYKMAPPLGPATIALALRKEDGEFEQMEMI